jgi:hypothetical protein
MHSTTYIVLVFLVVALVNSLPFAADNEHPNRQLMLNRGFFDCHAWSLTQGNPADLLAKTLKPPCHIPSNFPETLLGGWSVDPGCDASKQPNTCSFHKGAYGCYRHAFKNTGPGMQACYDNLGQWIADPWKGGGTVDAETPLGDILQQGLHALVDVAPYEFCCELILFQKEKACNFYYNKRPPGQCENKPAV